MSPSRGRRTTVRTPLAQLRVERGFTQKHLAAAAGLPLSTYRRLERGQIQNPSASLLAATAAALKLPIEDLMTPPSRRVSEESPATQNSAYVRHMGRARNIAATAAVRRERPEWLRRQVTPWEMHLLRAAREGDYDAFLTATHGSEARVSHMLAGDISAAVCRLALKQQQTERAAELADALVAASVPMTAGEHIINAMLDYAVVDLERSLMGHVDRDRKTWNPTGQDLLNRAFETLRARVAWAVGQPYDGSLFGGNWPSPRA